MAMAMASPCVFSRNKAGTRLGGTRLGGTRLFPSSGRENNNNDNRSSSSNARVGVTKKRRRRRRAFASRKTREVRQTTTSCHCHAAHSCSVSRKEAVSSRRRKNLRSSSVCHASMWTPPPPERQGSSSDKQDSRGRARSSSPPRSPRRSSSSSSPSLAGHAANVLGAMYSSVAKPLFLRAVHAGAVPVSVVARQVGGLVGNKKKTVAANLNHDSKSAEEEFSSLRQLFLEEEEKKKEKEKEKEKEGENNNKNQANPAAAVSSSVSVKSFLKDVSDDTELLQNFRMMSSMSEQAYYTNHFTEDDIWKRYGLNLVVSSREFKESISKLDFDEQDIFQEGDGMAVPFAAEEEIVRSMEKEMEKQLKLEDMYYDEWQANLKESVKQQVQEEEAEEKEAEAEAEEGINGGLMKQTPVQKALETAKTFTTFVSGYTRSLNQLLPVGGETSNDKSQTRSSTKKKLPDNDPCEWFIADHPTEPLRYISLQGSDSVDHWVTNLSFEPVDFEGGDLNVKIHAGIYKAAQKLESQLFPAMEEHISKFGPDRARFIFTGHSLGGAIACALVMMLVHRKMLQGDMVKGIYTYGCPAFICESCGCECGSDDCTCGAAGGNGMLLERLNLKSSLFKHLCMHRDIVPKAFACDYTVIREILRKMDTYKEHGCLKGSKGECYFPSLYRHLGDVYFLQPDTKFLQFARPEGDNPILPNGTGIWKMVEPPQSLKVAMNTMNRITSSLQNEWAFGDDLTLYNYAQDVNQAIGEILNSPHPLEQLSETAAYGHEGGISRFHKPKNYTRALGVLLMGEKENHNTNS